jgi:hypothetical protein
MEQLLRVSTEISARFAEGRGWYPNYPTALSWREIYRPRVCDLCRENVDGRWDIAFHRGGDMRALGITVEGRN